jgi:hypothetical protein
MTWSEIGMYLLYFFNHSSLFVQAAILFVFIVIIPIVLFITGAVYLNGNSEIIRRRRMGGHEEREILEREMELFEEELCPVDKVPFEDKIIAAYDERAEVLSPWELENLVQESMAQLPDDLTQEQREDIHDVMFEAITSALDTAR